MQKISNVFSYIYLVNKFCHTKSWKTKKLEEAIRFPALTVSEHELNFVEIENIKIRNWQAIVTVIDNWSQAQYFIS